MEKEKNYDNNWVIIALGILALFIFLCGSCDCSGSSSDYDSGSDYNSGSSHSESKEKRCSYCGKVIINSDGVPIHITNGKCDYCGF